MVKPAKRLEQIKRLALAGRFGRLGILVLIVAVGGVALTVSHGSAPKPKHCTTEACFDPAFNNCAPATLDHAIQPEGSIRYKILYNDIRSGGCYVTVAYTKIPNPAWENKPMTCVFNNKLSLDQAASAVYSSLSSGQNTYGCTGPLVVIIQQTASAQ